MRCLCGLGIPGFATDASGNTPSLGNNIQPEAETLPHSHDLRWILLAWGVCALAAAFKFARLARAMRGSLNGPTQPSSSSTQAMRERLERIWQQR